MLGGLFSWIVFGAVVGLIAKWIMPGKDPGGVVFTVLLGMAGSVIGGILFGRWNGWIGSIVCSLALLWLYKKYVHKDSVEI